MSLSPELTGWLDAARSTIERANSIDAVTRIHNARAHVGNVLAYVEPAAGILRAVENLETHLDNLRVELTRAPYGRADDPAVAQARELALLALSDVIRLLEDARPNSAARAMGIDW